MGWKKEERERKKQEKAKRNEKIEMYKFYKDQACCTTIQNSGALSQSLTV